MTGLEGPEAATGGLLLLLAAALLLAASGLPALLLGWRSPASERWAAFLAVVGSAVGVAGGIALLAAPGASSLQIAWLLPGGTSLGGDALTGFFALPVFVVGGLGAVYGSAYWDLRRHPRHGRRLRFCYGAGLASLVLLLLARDGFTFLVAWEAMALTTYFLVVTEEERPAVREAGWTYLLYSHAALLCLFALFALQARIGGGFAFGPVPAAAPAGLRSALFLLALVGFGIKAGVMPFHSWLPGAHASAPSHVSALMSGVVLKMGIYGLVRVLGLVEAPPVWWGATLLALGALSSFFGVVFAIGQHDLKRLLAYHSIENIGIILLGLGLAVTGRATGRTDWVVLGMAGCLLHVWNHALFKSLLFLGAGSVLHATGSRELDRLGGLARRMPATAALFLLGSVAIAGLPPLNGFVSELSIYLGLTRAALGPGALWVALAAPVLAATGALAVACFVKVYGIVFLGAARSPAAQAAHESPRRMLVPMAALGGACAAIGVAPGLFAPAVDRAIAAWAGGVPGGASWGAFVPLAWMPVAAGALLLLAGLLAFALAPRVQRARARQPELPTWDCGFVGTSPRLQYTASSFAELVTSRFAWALAPEVREPRIAGLFPAPSSFHSEAGDSVLDRILRPAAHRVQALAARLRLSQQGSLQQYILYIVIALVALLLVSLRPEWILEGLGGR